MSGTILVVDDEQDFVELMSFNLRKHGYEVLVATNGLDAVLLARRKRPDVIVLDVMLGALDGFTVCGILRRESSTRTIPVIMVTAARGEIARLNGFDAGADAFLSKPFSPHELVARVEDALHGRRESSQRRPSAS
jgi:DNA-binding response OmpR family regulator